MFKPLLSLVLILLFAGCASQPPTHYYRLQAVSPESEAVQSAKPASLGIGPVRLPSMLDYKGLVSEESRTGVRVASHDLWAGELDKEVAGTISELINARILGLDIVTIPWDTRFRPEYQLSLDIQRFSGEVGGEAFFKLNTVLLGNFGRKKLQSYSLDLAVEVEGDNYSAYVEALSQLLAEFADVSSAELLRHLSSDKQEPNTEIVLEQ